MNFFLSQLQGGPCGVLAPLQGLIIKKLVFGGSTQDPPSADEVLAALVESMAFTLGRVTYGDTVEVALISEADQETDPLPSVFSARMHLSDYRRLVISRFSDFLDSPSAVLQFVFSLVLTKTPEEMHREFDDPTTPLIGRFGHCSQELVNLMLTGTATSNVFDGVQEMHYTDEPHECGDGCLKLTGVQVEHPLAIGYLSELEALRYLQVGNTLKFPTLPIWIIGSASHYTVLFGRKVSDAAVSTERAVDLEISRVFRMHAMVDGIAEEGKLQVLLRDMKLQGLEEHKSIVKEGLILQEDFRAWVKEKLGIKDETAVVKDLNLWLVNGLEPVRVAEVTVSFSDIPKGEDESVLIQTIQTRWPGATVHMRKI